MRFSFLFLYRAAIFLIFQYAKTHGHHAHKFILPQTKDASHHTLATQKTSLAPSNDLTGFKEATLASSPRENYTPSTITLWDQVYKMPVFGVDITFQNVQGDIPPALWTCTDVRALCLSYNQLTGPLSDCIKNLKYLESLELEDNKFFGPLPKSFSDLPLASVNLEKNAFEGAFISHSSDITYINMCDTLITSLVLSRAPKPPTILNDGAPLESVYVHCALPVAEIAFSFVEEAPADTPANSMKALRNRGVDDAILINADNITACKDLLRIYASHARIRFVSKKGMAFPAFLQSLGVSEDTEVLYHPDGTCTFEMHSPTYADARYIFENAGQRGIDAIAQKLAEMEAWGPLLDENDTPLSDAVKRAKAFEALYISDAPRQKSARSIL